MRFDGVRFTVFNKSNSPGIITNRFVWLYEDAPGDLWASTEDGALTRLHQGRFTTYTKGQGLPGERVNKIGDDGQGNLIVLFFSPTQVYRWWQGRFEPAAELRLPPNATAPERNQARRMPLGEGLGKIFLFIDGQLRSFNTRQTLFDNSILAQDQQGQIWFSNVDGLFKVEQGGLVLVRRWGKGCPARNRD